MPCRIDVPLLLPPLMLVAALSACNGAESPTQLGIHSLMTSCGTNDDSCTGRPAEGATVEVTNPAGKVVASGTLDEGGMIQFDIDPGTYEVVVTKNDVSTEPSQVVISSGQYMDLTANLPKPDYWPEG